MPVLLMGLLVGAFFYTQHVQQKLFVAEQAVNTQKQALENMQNEIKQIQAINSELNALNEKYRKDSTALRSKFSSRDLGLFMETDPEKAQTVINNATQRALRCIELASGAQLNEKERNAKTPEEANRECPGLISKP
jgi:L,D-peptidoglycan transpeptidase YkuD (ErfK/YbiS/YcfS/YnhG family)